MKITTEVSKFLLSHLALPHAGHLLISAFHIFAYLEKKHNARMVFDPTYLVIDISSIPTHDDRMDFYGNVEEAIPSSAPTPYGKDIVTCCFVDADHAVDKLSPEDLAPASLFL